MKVPEWIAAHHFPKPDMVNAKGRSLQHLLRVLSLHTVCEEARCPNIGECFGQGVATFLILGNVCTRSCRFCGVKNGTPVAVDREEPRRVADAVYRLGLSHAVITSVTRDDLQDGGASQFVAVVREIREYKIQVPTIELLLPVLDLNSLKAVVSSHPEVIAHNVETVPRLYPKVRPKFKYSDSLKFLGQVKNLGRGGARASTSRVITKSGIMVGLGETKSEVVKVMEDLREQMVDILTIGQYLRPPGRQLPVVEYVHPQQFAEYERIGQEVGFKYIASGPYVRSSYKAKEALTRTQEIISKL